MPHGGSDDRSPGAPFLSGISGFETVETHSLSRNNPVHERTDRTDHNRSVLSVRWTSGLSLVVDKSEMVVPFDIPKANQVPRDS
jgi:hypothetical protein